MKSILGLIKVFLLAVLGKKYGLGDVYTITARNAAGLWDELKAAREQNKQLRFTIGAENHFDKDAGRFVCKFLHYAMVRYETSLPIKIYYYGLIRALNGEGRVPSRKGRRIALPVGLVCAYGWEHHLRLILRRLCAPFVRCMAGLMTVFCRSRALDSAREIYITGWYGTETTGDKAILGGIIRQARRICPGLSHVYVSSIVPYFTEETMEQLSIGDTAYTVIGRRWRDNRKAIRRCDWVIMGGGPLMELYEVYTVLFAVMRARLRGKRAIVWGCGIGPLHSRGMKRAVRLLLKLSDLVVLRDAFSPTVYPEVVKGIAYHPCIDPAVAYLLDVGKDRGRIPPEAGMKTVLFCIRELPKQYCTSAEAHRQVKERFIGEIGRLAAELLKDPRIRIRFFPMNTFVIGQDDREYYDELQKVLPVSDRIEFLREDFTLQGAIEQFLQADAAVAMRFHSVVFATTLGIPALAVDYDMLGGKIHGFMEGLGLMDRHVPIAEATAERMLPVIQGLLGQDARQAGTRVRLKEAVENMAQVIEAALAGEEGTGCA